MNPFDQLIDEPKSETTESKNIRDILYRRSDLSTFVVHLTEDKESLEGIVKSWIIEARNIWGAAKKKLKECEEIIESQKCVCFTETPLEYLYLMINPIKERQFKPESYGIAITKKLARKKGINPVWYVDITPGHDWLMNPINELVSKANGTFDQSPISKIAPFIEQMGSGSNQGANNQYRKEFWWEREWRHVGNFNLPEHVLLLCPESDFDEFETLAKSHDPNIKCIDPKWGLEKIIARLAGFENEDIDVI